MKNNYTKRGFASQKLITVASLAVAACLLGTVGYMLVSGIMNPTASLPVASSSSSSMAVSSVPAASSVPVGSSVPVESVPSPQEIAAVNYTDSPYFRSALPVLVNNTTPIADGLEDQMQNNDEFTQIAGYGSFWIHQDAADALKAMLDDAKAEGFTLTIGARGGFRTYARQQERYNAMKAAGDTDEAIKLANAMPGYCENELGLSIDFDPEDSTFASNDAYNWLVSHCTNYGFILRWPQDKESVTGVTFQPYHFRFVGINHAKAMTEANLCLEEYLAG